MSVYIETGRLLRAMAVVPRRRGERVNSTEADGCDDEKNQEMTHLGHGGPSIDTLSGAPYSPARRHQRNDLNGGGAMMISPTLIPIRNRIGSTLVPPASRIVKLMGDGALIEFASAV